MTVWILEKKCDDEFYGYNLVAIFSTEEKAKFYIKDIKEWEKSDYSIEECQIDPEE